jgi:DNA-binding NarL/FixJ family response regulator
MPDYDGIYALEKIRQLDPSTNIIMVTADMTADTLNKLEKLNASAIVYKPFDIDPLMETVYNLTEGMKIS